MLFLLILFGLATGQRLPPGINPRLYHQAERMQPAQNQQYLYQPESTVQYIQDMKHHQGDNLAQKVVLNTDNIQLERSHIQEHMPVPLDINRMSDTELQFHYFKMHDSDNNNRLDGCEIYKALIHLHDADPKNRVNSVVKTLTDVELAALIDPLLEMDDTSRDGYIDYPEFVKARNKKPEKGE